MTKRITDVKKDISILNQALREIESLQLRVAQLEKRVATLLALYNALP